MKIWKRLIKNEKGSAIVLVSLGMVVLLSMSALVVDVGGLFVTKSHLKKTANASVLSGAQELVKSNSAVTGVVNQILEAHKEKDSLNNLNISTGYEVKVKLTKEVPLTFSKLLGKASAPVDAVAAAQILSMGRAAGVVPIGVDENVSFDFYDDSYALLKVDEEEVDTGFFGILALDGTGASIYGASLRNGSKSEISVGDIIQAQTGNMAGATKKEIRDRLDACSYNGNNFLAHITEDPNCRRLLLVPIYQKILDGSQVKEVIIKGFAYFYITSKKNSKTITGMFIKKAGTGFTVPGAVERGAYVIKLVE